MSVQLSLEETIFNDMIEALKGKEKLKLSTLRLIRAAIKNAEISKKDKLIEETRIKFEFKGLQDIGPAMKEVMPQLKGKADGKIVNKMVRNLLDNSKE